jgi:predicted Zn-dependent protease
VAAVGYDDGETAFRAGQYRDAENLFSTYVQRRPENPWGHYMLGLSAWKAGDLARAEEAFERALTLDPQHRKSLLNSARVLLELHRPQDALERVEGALATESRSAEALRLLGRVRAELGRTDEAIDAYQRAVALDDKDAWAMNNLGLLYIQLGRYEEALPPLARATQLRGKSPIFQNNLAVALERVGYFEAARAAYEAALAADSTYAKASVGLARVRERRDDPELEPVELAALAARFQEDVKRWQDSTVAADTTSSGEEVVRDTMRDSVDRQ